jgi:hypothetical protein
MNQYAPPNDFSNDPSPDDNPWESDPLAPSAERDETVPDPFGALLDCMLEEALGGARPADLRTSHAMLTQSARDGLSMTGLFSPDELNAVVDAARRDMVESASATTASRLASPPQSSYESANERSASRSDRDRWVYLAVAASAVGTLLAVSWFQRGSELPLADSNRASRPETAEPSLSGSPVPSSTGSTAARKSLPSDDLASPAFAASQQDPSHPNREGNPAPSDSAPDRPDSFQSQIASAAKGTEARSNRNNPTITSSASMAMGSEGDREITTVIDQQFKHLWNRLGVDAQPSSDQERIENRLAMILVGRLPTSAERSQMRTPPNAISESIAGTARQWIASPEFDRHWSRLLTEYYLDGTPSTESEQTSRVAFQTWLEESIRSQAPLGSIEKALVSADVEPSSASPEAYWLQHWMSRRSVADNALLDVQQATAVGLTANQVGSLDSLALQTLRLSGRNEAACVRCHADGSKAEPIPMAFLAASQKSEAPSPIDAAFFASVASAYTQLVGARKAELYQADNDDLVRVAVPLLPDGSKLSGGPDRREALSEWFENTAAPRGPMVDFVWSQLLGQPLLPNVGLSDSEGLDERRDLLHFLANKAQQERHGLKKLVYWIAVSSPVFMREPLLDPNQYLKMDAATLARYESEKQTFARYAGTGRWIGTTQPIETLVEWVRPMVDSSVDRALLAQPRAGALTTDESTRMTAAPWSQWSPARLSFEMSSQATFTSMSSVSQKLATSGLSAEQLVDHAFLISHARLPLESERQRIVDLVSEEEIDRSKTMLRLLNALQWY